MISKLSNLITRNLLKRNVIFDEEKELYDYGLFMLISYVVFFIISILFGIILNIPFLSIIFYISFCLVRNFAGGIHANSEIKCDIITTILILVSEILIRIFIDCSLVSIAFVTQIISSLCLCVFKPVATSQKEINQQEKLYYHKKLILIVCFINIFSFVLFYFNFHNVIYSTSIGITLSTLLFLLGKVSQV